jgi:hypothetical protein
LTLLDQFFFSYDAGQVLCIQGMAGPRMLSTMENQAALFFADVEKTANQ